MDNNLAAPGGKRMKKYRLRTALALSFLVFTHAYLCGLCIFLFMRGSWLIDFNEKVRWVAGIEVVLTALVVLLGIERIVRLRER